LVLSTADCYSFAFLNARTPSPADIVDDAGVPVAFAVAVAGFENVGADDLGKRTREAADYKLACRVAAVPEMAGPDLLIGNAEGTAPLPVARSGSFILRDPLQCSLLWASRRCHPFGASV
jgi:hypothetical protein